MTFRWCLAIIRDFQRYTHNERDDDVNAIVILTVIAPKKLLDEKRPKKSIKFEFSEHSELRTCLVLMTGDNPRAPKQCLAVFSGR